MLFQRFFVCFGWFENPRVLNSVSHENLGIFVAFMHRVPANIFLCKIMLFEILKISTNRPHVPSDRVGCIRSISWFNWRIIHGNTLLWLTKTNLLGPIFLGEKFYFFLESCSSSPCQNNGACETGMPPTCSCPAGYSGEFCQNGKKNSQSRVWMRNRKNNLESRKKFLQL